MQITNTGDFARTWGKMKSNRSEEMNYEKMSRAMRQVLRGCILMQDFTLTIRMKIIIVGITMAVKGKEEKGILLWLKRDVFTTSNEQNKMLDI